MRLTPILFSYYSKYVQREIAKATGYSIYKPVQGWRHVRKRNWIYSENPPWSDKAKELNHGPATLKELVEPIPESQWFIHRGDRVSDIIV